MNMIKETSIWWASATRLCRTPVGVSRGVQADGPSWGDCFRPARKAPELYMTRAYIHFPLKKNVQGNVVFCKKTLPRGARRRRLFSAAAWGQRVMDDPPQM